MRVCVCSCKYINVYPLQVKSFKKVWCYLYNTWNTGPPGSRLSSNSKRLRFDVIPLQNYSFHMFRQQRFSLHGILPFASVPCAQSQPQAKEIGWQRIIMLHCDEMKISQPPLPQTHDHTACTCVQTSHWFSETCLEQTHGAILIHDVFTVRTMIFR